MVSAVSPSGRPPGPRIIARAEQAGHIVTGVDGEPIRTRLVTVVIELENGDTVTRCGYFTPDGPLSPPDCADGRLRDDYHGPYLFER